ncbi:MAG: slipin family protein [Spirochaetales bacterium]|nr:slipin family protein [Spirochaetales bacterium]
MNLMHNREERVKNLKGFKIQKDFHFSSVSFLFLGLFIMAGYLLQVNYGASSDLMAIVQVSGAILGAGVVLTVLPLWSMVIFVIIAIQLNVIALIPGSYFWLTFIGSAGIVISASIQLVYQWDKVVILRAGKFRKVHGPGLFFLVPLLDRIAAFVDTRIRVTDFTAEKTLTNDTVPVHVDALAFWMIWEPKQAVLEVEDYFEAVSLSGQTALRDAIGKHKLATLLAEREELGNEIQQKLDAKTNPWGITILSIEITEIIIPKELEDAMSKQAQAEREKKSRVILGEAEVEVAAKFEEAALKYSGNPTALQLRAMNMVYEGLKHNNSMMLMPSSALDNMNLGAVLGTAALNKVKDLQGQEITNKPVLEDKDMGGEK